MAWTLCLFNKSLKVVKTVDVILSELPLKEENVTFESLTKQFNVQDKNVIQGKLIAVAYTLRTYWNQFFLGGICKQRIDASVYV